MTTQVTQRDPVERGKRDWLAVSYMRVRHQVRLSPASSGVELGKALRLATETGTGRTWLTLRMRVHRAEAGLIAENYAMGHAVGRIRDLRRSFVIPAVGGREICVIPGDVIDRILEDVK